MIIIYKMKYTRKSRSSRRYRPRTKANPRNSLVLYPPANDSLIMYFNTFITHTDAASPAAMYYGAYNVQNFAALVNLRPYFGQYRVERISVRLMFAELPNITQVHMATTHSADGATFAASTPTLPSIRAYRDWQVYSIQDKCPKKVWKFDPCDSTETNYLDIPAAAIANDSQFVCGGVQYYVVQQIGTGVPSVFAYVQYKVRLRGKQAIAC